MFKLRIWVCIIEFDHYNNQKFKQIHLFRMGIVNMIKQLVRKLDLFQTNQFLRYQKETQYKTVLGGSVSILIIVLMIGLFINTALQTVNRQLINSTISSSVQPNPSLTTFKTSVDGGYMFGLYMVGVNLNNPHKKFFDVTLTQNFYGQFIQPINSTTINLVQCTFQHFAFNSKLKSQYSRFISKFSLCPPIGTQFQIRGTGTSNLYARIELTIKKCNTTLSSNCASQSQLIALQNSLGGHFSNGLISINSIVNANDQHYKDYYLQDGNYFYFDLNTTSSAELTAQLEHNQINTDVSLLPFEDIQNQKFLTISQKMMQRNKPLNSGFYTKIIIQKSKRQVQYSRGFNKLDNLFSYIGGLVGVILLSFLVLNVYSEAAFAYNIAQQLFSRQNGDEVKSFNFFYFISTKIKKLLNFCNCSTSWKDTDYFNDQIQQAQQQLDIALIIQRLVYLQNSFSICIKQPQLQSLSTHKKISVKLAKERRIKYNVTQKEIPQISDNKQKDKEEYIEQRNRKQSNANTIINQISEQNSQEPIRDRQDEQSQYIRKRIKTKIIEVAQQTKKGSKYKDIKHTKTDHLVIKENYSHSLDKSKNINKVQKQDNKNRQSSIFLQELE